MKKKILQKCRHLFLELFSIEFMYGHLLKISIKAIIYNLISRTILNISLKTLLHLVVFEKP